MSWETDEELVLLTKLNYTKFPVGTRVTVKELSEDDEWFPDREAIIGKCATVITNAEGDKCIAVRFDNEVYSGIFEGRRVAIIYPDDEVYFLGNVELEKLQ